MKGVTMNTLTRPKRLMIAAILVMVSTMSMAAMAVAQTAEKGVASFYSDKFQGKKTSSGEVYDKNGLTASHKKLPYGTKVKVTNVANGKSVVLTVNDRMAASNKAVIEVSRHAAEELGFVKTGKATVTVEAQK